MGKILYCYFADSAQNLHFIHLSKAPHTFLISCFCFSNTFLITLKLQFFYILAQSVCMTSFNKKTGKKPRSLIIFGWLHMSFVKVDQNKKKRKKSINKLPSSQTLLLRTLYMHNIPVWKEDKIYEIKTVKNEFYSEFRRSCKWVKLQKYLCRRVCLNAKSTHRNSERVCPFIHF